MVQTAAIMSGSRHTPCSRGIIISLSPSPAHHNQQTPTGAAQQRATRTPHNKHNHRPTNAL